MFSIPPSLCGQAATPSEQQFANEFLALKTTEERAAYLKQNRARLQPELVQILNNTAVNQLQKGNRTVGHNLHLRALEIAEFLHDETAKGDCLTYIGMYFVDEGEFRTALEFYAKALESYKKAGKPSNEVMAMHKIASVHLDQKDFKDAERVYERALVLAKKGGTDLDRARVSLNLGITYEALDLYHKAREVLKAGSESAQKAKDDDVATRIKAELANLETLSPNENC
jgi:tetratricopeptide (TPR) repeat protein